MRLFLLITLALIPSMARSEAQTEISWQMGFQTASASDGASSLVMLVTTNDIASNDINSAEDNEPVVWCQDEIESAYGKLLSDRPDLNQRLRLQHIRAGWPKELTGGETRSTPKRAVVAICDGDFHLLSFVVGVPDTDQMLTLIEDAEEVRAVFVLSDSVSTTTVTHEFAQRSRERLDRKWVESLDELLLTIPVDFEIDNTKARLGSYQMACNRLDQFFAKDMALRFGFQANKDALRLAVLEQHVEARLPWCESAMMFLIGIDFSRSWQAIIERIWYEQLFDREAKADDLLDWYDDQIEHGTIVLSITPPSHLANTPWPPAVQQDSKRLIGWQKADADARNHIHREVDAQQLAVLIRSKALKAVDLQKPSRARYVLFAAGKAPLVIRESSRPGQLSGLIRRSQMNRVKP